MDDRNSLSFLRRQPLALPSVSDRSLACFQLSGGTTGVPKLIARHHYDYLYNVRASMEASGFDGNTVYLTVLPMAHNFPLACPGLMGALFAGGTVVITRDQSAAECFRLIREESVTVTSLVPPLAMTWLDAAETGAPALESLQVLQVGGAKFNENAARRVRSALGCTLQQVFGMAEGLVCFTGLTDPDDVVATTQGRPMSKADEVEVVNERGEVVPDGTVGYLRTRGPYTIRGYAGHHEANRTAFSDDGYYQSGDLVRHVGNGYLSVEGRDKDQINRGGEKISAEEVENVLIAHESILDVAVVGIPDEYYGERPLAFIVSRGKRPTVPDLRAFMIAEGVSELKIPDRFRFVERFPVTGVGKVSRNALRESLKTAYLESRQEQLQK